MGQCLNLPRTERQNNNFSRKIKKCEPRRQDQKHCSHWTRMSQQTPIIRIARNMRRFSQMKIPVSRARSSLFCKSRFGSLTGWSLRHHNTLLCKIGKYFSCMRTTKQHSSRKQRFRDKTHMHASYENMFCTVCMNCDVMFWQSNWTCSRNQLLLGPGWSSIIVLRMCCIKGWNTSCLRMRHF